VSGSAGWSTSVGIPDRLPDRLSGSAFRSAAIRIGYRIGYRIGTENVLSLRPSAKSPLLPRPASKVLIVLNWRVTILADAALASSRQSP